MVRKYAQCAFLLMVDWLGQCPSAVLQAGESQHPAPPGTWAHTTAPYQRCCWQQGAQGTWALWACPKGSHHHFQEKQALLLPSSPFFLLKDGLGLVSARWPCPSKMCHGNNWSSTQKNGSWSHTAHRLCFIHCMVPLGCFQMWCIPPINVFIWHLAACLNVVQVFEFEMDGQFRMISCNFFQCLVFVDPNSIYVIII